VFECVVDVVNVGAFVTELNDSGGNSSKGRGNEPTELDHRRHAFFVLFAELAKGKGGDIKRGRIFVLQLNNASECPYVNSRTHLLP